MFEILRPPLVGAIVIIVASHANSARSAEESLLTFCAQEISESEWEKIKNAEKTPAPARIDAADRKSVSTRLANSDSRLEINGRTLRVLDPDGTVTTLTGLNSGDDYNGWGEFSHLEGGWIYLTGAQYDALLKIERAGDVWTQVENIRIIDQQPSVAGQFFSWLLGLEERQLRKDGLTGIFAKSNRRAFSAALQAMLFLNDGEKLERGAFRPIGTGPRSWFYGDLINPKVALLRGGEGELFAYDGMKLVEVTGPRLEPGKLTQLLDGTRRFLSSGTKAFELRGDRPDKLQLIELRAADQSPLGWFEVLLGNEGTVVFITRNAIYQVRGDLLEPVWHPAPAEHIFGPKDAGVSSNEGLLITSENSSGALRRRLLISKCRVTNN